MTGLQEEAKPATDWGKQPQSERPARPDLTGPFDDVSLEDPKTYRAFVRSLMGRIEARLATKLDDDVQAELASLTRLLASMPPKAVAANRVYFELAFDLLAAEQPNLLLARSIRWQLAAVNDRTSYGITRFIALCLRRYSYECRTVCIVIHICSGFFLSLANDERSSSTRTKHIWNLRSVRCTRRALSLIVDHRYPCRFYWWCYQHIGTHSGFFVRPHAQSPSRLCLSHPEAFPGGHRRGPGVLGPAGRADLVQRRRPRRPLCAIPRMGGRVPLRFQRALCPRFCGQRHWPVW